MTVRPQRAVLAPLLVALLLYLLTRASGVAWLALGAAAALALPVTSLLVRPRIDQLEVVTVPPARAVAGDLVDLELRICNAGRYATPACSWSLEHAALGAIEVAVPALAAGQQVRVPGRLPALPRGLHRLGSARLSTTAPYGLLRWSRALAAVEDRLLVHPVTGLVRDLPSAGAPATSERSLPLAGHGVEVLGLRPWRQGDPLRHVSPRATARHGRPVVLERERETGPSLVVLAVGGGRGPAWEQAVSTAASRSLAALRDGTPPVLLADPPPVRLDHLGILDFFAEVDTAGPVRPADLRAALQAVGRGGVLLLLAPPGGFEHTLSVRRAAESAGVRVEVLGA